MSPKAPPTADTGKLNGEVPEPLPFKPFFWTSLTLLLVGVVALIAGAHMLGAIIIGIGAATIFASLFVTDWYRD